MHKIKIWDKNIWPYEAIMSPDGKTLWDILPIMYDNAIIELTDSNSYYRKDGVHFVPKRKLEDITIVK